mgnify:CR=1 FL=1
MASREVAVSQIMLNVARVIREADLHKHPSLSQLDVGSWGVFGKNSVIVCDSYREASHLSSSLNRCL